ncbi:PP2C family protein-serine/threonine phosphatase [Streptomyces sp. NPDC048639]|uniref:PP2C family protein-serine/threonine phosphatase n=1 Tax=Streptomyces sp. NPDC048639 TaxID=3365581 RepID=UPI0037116870
MTKAIGQPGLTRLLVVLLLVAGAAADIFGPEPYMGLPLLAATPLVAAAMLSFRESLAVAVVACAASVALDIHLGRPVTALVVDLADVAVTSCLALLINVLLTRHRRRLAQARDVAEAAQRALLPDPPARAGELEVAARYEVAQAEARIGGDLYAVQATPFGVRAIIGDVRGKGLQAVASVSVLIGAFRQEAENAPTLDELAQRLDAALRRDNEHRSAPTGLEDFTTALLAEIVPGRDTVRRVNRGHPSPFLVQAGDVVRLDPTDPQLPLGMELGGLDAGPGAGTADSFAMPPGATLLLITDGVTEARNEMGAFYDIEDAGLGTRTYRNPRQLIDTLVQDVARWTDGPYQDDMAIIALARIPDERPSRPR